MAKRLRPLTDNKPKCLLKVGERTLLERTVRAMQQAGISEFVVVTGYCADQIRDFLESTKKGASSRGALLFIPAYCIFLVSFTFDHLP